MATATTPDAKAMMFSQLEQLAVRVKALTSKGVSCANIEKEIGDANDLVASGKLDDAQAIYTKATADVDKAEANFHAEPLAWQLFWVELLYLVLILLLGYLTIRYPNYWLWAGLIGLNARAAWFGALGGVTIGLYGIYSHIAVKDFDASFKLWYICKPIVGAIFGWFIVLVYYVGLVSVQGSQADVKSPQVPYAIAFLAGFSERFTIKIIDRLMTVLTTGDDNPNDKNKNKDKQSNAPPNF
jgi:hypothetical protein